MTNIKNLSPYKNHLGKLVDVTDNTDEEFFVVKFDINRKHYIKKYWYGLKYNRTKEEQLSKIKRDLKAFISQDSVENTLEALNNRCKDDLYVLKVKEFQNTSYLDVYKKLQKVY